MSLFVWVMMAIALWHFTIFLPDRFWGGIVGAFVAAIIGSAVFGFLVSGLQIPGRNDTHLITVLEAIPGTVIALVLSWLYGRYVEERGPKRRKPAPRRA